jgi:hypothetical protein
MGNSSWGRRPIGKAALRGQRREEEDERPTAGEKVDVEAFLAQRRAYEAAREERSRRRPEDR